MKPLKLAEKLSDAEVEAARDEFEMDYYPDYWEWQLREERLSVLALLEKQLYEAKCVDVEITDTGELQERSLKSFKVGIRDLNAAVLQLREEVGKSVCSRLPPIKQEKVLKDG